MYLNPDPKIFLFAPQFILGHSFVLERACVAAKSDTPRSLYGVLGSGGRGERGADSCCCSLLTGLQRLSPQRGGNLSTSNILRPHEGTSTQKLKENGSVSTY